MSEVTANGYSIREVSELTGVQPVTLRAWERRYGLLRPGRSERGHRIYGAGELRRINDILFWVDKGVAIGRVPVLLDDHGEEAAPVGTDRTLEPTLEILAEGHVRRLEKQIGEQLALYPLESVISGYIEPVRRHLRGASPEPLARADLALFETVLHQKMAVRLLNRAPGRRQSGVWVAPLGGPAELDVLLLALCVGQGLPVRYLLAETEVEAVLARALSTNSRGVLFCLSPALSGTRLLRQLGRRAARLDLPVYVCCPPGRESTAMPAGVRWLGGDHPTVAGQLETRLEAPE